MKIKTILAAALCGCMLTGCVSELTQREYAEWQKSEDAKASVNVFQFERYYMNGWRERAEEKKQARLAKEAAEREDRASYAAWQKSNDNVKGVTLDSFLAQYKADWDKRVRTEHQKWLKSDDGVVGVSVAQFRDKYMKGWKERAQKKLLQKEYKLWLGSRDGVKGVSYETFAAKYRKSWRTKVAKKRAAARQKAVADELRRTREERIKNMAGESLKDIRAQYAEGKKYICPFPRHNGDIWLSDKQKSDWLKTWTEPRLELSEEDKLAGEALLSEFGMKYLPNAYANYEKKKDAAAELQQVFNEEFPEPWTIKESNPKWNSFNKVLEKFAKVRTESFVCHDELCRYWLMWRLGIMSEKELAESDAQPLAVHLLAKNVQCVKDDLAKTVMMDKKVADFATKYAPESAAVYQKLDREFKELDTLLDEVFKQRQQMDDVRFDRVLAAAVDKRNEIVSQMNTLSQALQTWHMDHRTTVKSSEDVSKCDQEMSRQLNPFVKSLSNYVKEKAFGRVIPASDMIAIPCGTYRDERVSSFRMQRTEVTQLQWMSVMSNNPSRFVGLDRPVENVSWNDCQAFIKRVSAIDGVPYRLPKVAEWNHACLAGSKGSWGRRKNGEEGAIDVMCWYGAYNSRVGTHPVAQKEPNAWGLYDMHGNVWEWCEDLAASWPVYCGGSWHSDWNECTAYSSDRAKPDDRTCDRGFRLAAPLE